MKIVQDSPTQLIIKDTRKLAPKQSIMWGAVLLVVSVIGVFVGGQLNTLTCTQTDAMTIRCVQQSSWFELVPLGQQSIAELQEVRLDGEWGNDVPDVLLVGSDGELRFSASSLSDAEAMEAQVQILIDDEDTTLLMLSASMLPAMVQILISVLSVFAGLAGIVLLVSGLRPGPNVWVFDKSRELLTIGVSQNSNDVGTPGVLEEHPFYTLGRVSMTEDRDGDFQVHVEVQRTPKTLPGYNKNRDEVQQLVNRIQEIVDD